MKLEGELPYFHSNIGREPESESLELSGNELYKTQNQKVKEYENNVSIDLKRNERDLDISSYEKKSAECMTTSELEFFDSINDLKDEYVPQVRDFVEPVSLASKDVGSFMKFPNDTKPVKRSPTSPISDPPEERDPFENSVDVYMDKTIKECEPKPVVCYKESNNRVVKDICVDEGIPTKDKVLFETSVDEKACNLFPYIPNEDKETKKDNIGIDVLNLLGTKESHQVSANHDQSQDLMHKEEAVTEKLTGDVKKETLLGDKVFLQELDRQEPRTSDDKGEKVILEPDLHTRSEESENIVEEALLASPTLASAAVDEPNTDSVLLENGSFVQMLNPSASAACGQEECHQDGGCRCDETQNITKPVDGQSDDEAVNPVHHTLDESRFSAVGPVSSRISYSGSVPYSGSISIRSDSSTTSTRSFAFPILQNEWNSSPVRMAKAERSKYRKHRCWRQSLLCCRF